MNLESERAVKAFIKQAVEEACKTKSLLEATSVQYCHQTIYDVSFVETQYSRNGRLYDVSLTSLN